MIKASIPSDTPTFTTSFEKTTTFASDGPPPTLPTSNYPPTAGLKIAAADQKNLHTLANHLRGIALLWNESTSETVISSALNNWKMPIEPGSSYTVEGVNDPNLAEVITRLGFEIPRTKTQAIALRDTLDQKASAPVLGNSGGALSWPLPLSTVQQRAIIDTLDCNTAMLSGLALTDPRKGALGYLLDAMPLLADDLNDPDKALEKLLTSPTGQALGLAIQKDLKGIGTPASTYEYVLSAIHLGLDRESIERSHRNTVAGFDLAQSQHWGKPASAVFDALKAHLVVTGKANLATAHIAAHLLLRRVAPQFLVKDVPNQVAPGSQAWANFCIAVAKVEEEAPGTASKMTFTQVMQRADQIDTPDAESVQRAALIDWGVANGIISRQSPEAYSAPEVEVVRTRFNDQQNQRLTASEVLKTELPTRRQVALEKLKAHFPELEPDVFEAPVLLPDRPNTQSGARPLYDPNLPPEGYHSMLDVFMGASTLGKWKSDDPRIPIDKLNQSPALGTLDAFNSQFATAMDARKNALATTVRHLISQLPLEDRKKIEHGKISFFHETAYDTTYVPQRLDSKDMVLSFKVEQGGQRTIYEIDIQSLSIKRRDNYINLVETSWRDAHLERRREAFNPVAGGQARQSESEPVGDTSPNSFASLRSNMIADAFVEHLDVDNAAIKQAAEGSTAHERQLQSQKNAGEFFLNLIPFRSAIVNFSSGNYAEGALDLGMDIFSFVTAGAGTAARLAKVGASAISTGAKFIKGAKVIGVAAIGALNPVDGVGDLLVGAAKLTRRAANTVARGVQVAGSTGLSVMADGINTLKGTAGSYDLIKASKKHGIASIGTFKVADETVEGLAVRHNHQWYAYDEVKNQPFGAPIDDFNPSYTLDPKSQKSNGLAPHSVRHTPYNISSRAPRVRTPLPQGEYACAMKGKLEADHFKHDTKPTTLQKFNDDLRSHYDDVAKTLPARPVIPSVPTSIPTPDMLSDAFKTSDGVVLGERHDQMASFKTLFDSADTLKKSGVKRVYFEGLLSRPDLPGGLQDDGISMLGATGKARSNPSFNELKAKLELNGIEIVPLDHYYLTRHKDVKHLTGVTRTGHGSVRRLEEFNYYAAKTIEATSNGEKWVALVGMSHMKTSEGVPGLAEMTGSTAIGVFEHNKANLPLSSGFGPRSTPLDSSKPLTSNDQPGDLRIYVKAP